MENVSNTVDLMLSGHNDHKRGEIYDAFIAEMNGSLCMHPFYSIKDRQNLIALLPHFLGISTAFPYLQAGSQLPLLIHQLEINCDIPVEMELTCVVGNFLVWDETGGAEVLEKQGKSNLAQILQTKTQFHANILKSNLNALLGFELKPNFSSPTKEYITELISGFSHTNPVIRCAYMVAFEVHAEAIIKALWNSMKKHFDEAEWDLNYFEMHVGEEDPAEEYHIEMTRNMIDLIVKKQDEALFLNTAKQSINNHLEWAKLLIVLE